MHPIPQPALEGQRQSRQSATERAGRRSVDLPGGTIKTEGGDILLRTEGQVYTGLEFASIVLRTLPDGTRLLLGDIATIDDGFVETDWSPYPFTMNWKITRPKVDVPFRSRSPSVSVTVFAR